MLRPMPRLLSHNQQTVPLLRLPPAAMTPVATPTAAPPPLPPESTSEGADLAYFFVLSKGLISSGIHEL